MNHMVFYFILATSCMTCHFGGVSYIVHDLENKQVIALCGCISCIKKFLSLSLSH